MIPLSFPCKLQKHELVKIVMSCTCVFRAGFVHIMQVVMWPWRRSPFLKQIKNFVRSSKTKLKLNDFRTTSGPVCISVRVGFLYHCGIANYWPGMHDTAFFVVGIVLTTLSSVRKRKTFPYLAQSLSCKCTLRWFSERAVWLNVNWFRPFYKHVCRIHWKERTDSVALRMTGIAGSVYRNTGHK